MKERPILFSAPMVQAILAGRKTMTRRVVKPQPLNTGHFWPNDAAQATFDDIIANPAIPGRCPYGQPGDRLWVREGWRIGAWYVGSQAFAIDYRADNYSRKEWIEVQDDYAFDRLRVQSIEDAQFKLGHKENYKWNPGESPCRWRSSLHMRKEFSRITLEITGIRVEQLNEISEEDAMSEGCSGQICNDCDAEILLHHEGGEHYSISPKEAFKELWESINGLGSWEKNPWVWVVEFKRVAQ